MFEEVLKGQRDLAEIFLAHEVLVPDHELQRADVSDGRAEQGEVEGCIFSTVFGIEVAFNDRGTVSVAGESDHNEAKWM